MNIIRKIAQALHHPEYPQKWVWQSVSWDEIKEEVVKKILEVETVKSIPTSNYAEVIEVNLPIKFYWAEDGFDGVSFSYPARGLFEWEQEMLDKCMGVMKRYRDECSDART